MSAANAKPLTAAALARKVAQQFVWATVNAITGEVTGACFSRNAARKNREDGERVVRVDLRIKGARA